MMISRRGATAAHLVEMGGGWAVVGTANRKTLSSLTVEQTLLNFAEPRRLCLYVARSEPYTSSAAAHICAFRLTSAEVRDDVI
jgi:hypothetical protein